LDTSNPGWETIHPSWGSSLSSHTKGGKAMTFTKNERQAIGLFLTDAYHEREVKKKMKMLADMYSMTELFLIIDKLVEIGSLTDEDGVFLKKKMAKFYV
jgi:hypothetical protein